MQQTKHEFDSFNSHSYCCFSMIAFVFHLPPSLPCLLQIIHNLFSFPVQQAMNMGNPRIDHLVEFFWCNYLEMNGNKPTEASIHKSLGV